MTTRKRSRSFIQLVSLLPALRVPSVGRRLFHIEMASRYRPYVGPARTALAALCAILCMAIAWDVGQTVLALVDRQEVRAKLEQVVAQDQQQLQLAQQEGIDLSPASLSQLPAEVALANQLLIKRSFSWTQFLSGLEEAIPATVSIKSVRLDPSSSIIHLTGAAATVEDVTGLALRLQTHKVFRDPVLGQHHAGAEGFVEFDLTMKYYPQGV